MNKLITNLSKPFAFALLMGTLSSALVFHIGRWSVTQAEKTDFQEIALLSENIGHSYHLSKLTTGSQVKLKETIKKALENPRLVSVTLLSPYQEIILADNDSAFMPYQASREEAFPIKDTNGKVVGTVVLGLDPLIAPLRKKVLVNVLGTGCFGFLLSFVLCLILKNHRDPYLVELHTALRNVSYGNLEVDLPPPENTEYTDLASAFNQMLDGLRERERMKHSLGRIMDPKIAEILIKENPRVGGLRRQATILFCDIRNYTTICEELSHDELQEFLNEYWKGTVEIIMEQEGTIDKFHGDGVCVVFGAPNLHEDDSVRAVRTAWRLVKNVEELNKRRELQRKIPIQIGVGIHMGEVIAGNIGSDRRMDYTVVGDVVNVAARIEELNKKFGTKILISDNVYERVENFVKVKTLTLAHLRGHKRPILVHALREFAELEALVPEQQQQEKAA